MRRSWTLEELDFIKINYLNFTYNEIAQQLNRTEKSIRRKLNTLGYSKTVFVPVDETYFDKWTPANTYIYGFATADGCITCKYKQPSRFTFEFCLGRSDECILDYISSEISPGRKISRVDKYKDGKAIRLSHLKINSKLLVEKLVSLGLEPRKTGYEKFPKIPKRLYPDFLRGLFDGDGTVCRSGSGKTFGIYSANYNFLEQVREKCGFGLGKVYEKREDDELFDGSMAMYFWGIYNTRHLKRIFNYMYYDNHPYALDRKYQVFKSLL